MQIHQKLHLLLLFLWGRAALFFGQFWLRGMVAGDTYWWSVTFYTFSKLSLDNMTQIFVHNCVWDYGYGHRLSFEIHFKTKHFPFAQGSKCHLHLAWAIQGWIRKCDIHMQRGRFVALLWTIQKIPRKWSQFKRLNPIFSICFFKCQIPKSHFGILQSLKMKS